MTIISIGITEYRSHQQCFYWVEERRVPCLNLAFTIMYTTQFMEQNRTEQNRAEHIMVMVLSIGTLTQLIYTQYSVRNAIRCNNTAKQVNLKAKHDCLYIL